MAQFPIAFPEQVGAPPVPVRTGTGGPPRTLLLGMDGDLAVVDGRLAIATDAQAIAQAIQSRLRFFRGEWFADARAGVPWLQTLLRKGTPMDVVRSILRAEVLATPGVVGVPELTATVDTRTRMLSVSFRATITTGEQVAGSTEVSP